MDIMPYKKVGNIELVKSIEQFREYIKHRSYGSNRMLKVFDRKFLFAKTNFSVDDKRAVLYKSHSIDPGIARLELAASKEEVNYGQVYIDTGYVEITDEEKILPSRTAKARGWSLDKLQEEGLAGLRQIRSISEASVELYEDIFSASKRRT